MSSRQASPVRLHTRLQDLLGARILTCEAPAVAALAAALARLDHLAGAGNPGALARLFEDFAELCEAGGPLPTVRLAPEAFAEIVGPHLAQAPPGDGDQAFAFLCRRCLPPLAAASDLAALRDQLLDFVLAPFVPDHDRLAATCALVAWPASAAPGASDDIALQALFRAQVQEHLGSRG